MKYIYVFIGVLLVFLSLTGCIAFHEGTMSNSGYLSSNNFRYVKTGISGMSQATYVLGIGGMRRYSLVAEAKQNMLIYYPLSDNQAIVNSTVSYKHSYFLGNLVVTVKCVVSADIVEFLSNNDHSPNGQVDNDYAIHNSNNDFAININDSAFIFNKVIADQLSDEEKNIYLTKTKGNIKFVAYSDFSNVNIDDIVAFKDRFGILQFGFVEFIIYTENLLGVSYFNSEHKKGVLKMSHSQIMKVE